MIMESGHYTDSDDIVSSENLGGRSGLMSMHGQPRTGRLRRCHVQGYGREMILLLKFRHTFRS